jgi:hypothetical protein
MQSPQMFDDPAVSLYPAMGATQELEYPPKWHLGLAGEGCNTVPDGLVRRQTASRDC